MLAYKVGVLSNLVLEVRNISDKFSNRVLQWEGALVGSGAAICCPPNIMPPPPPPLAGLAGAVVTPLVIRTV